MHGPHISFDNHNYVTNFASVAMTNARTFQVLITKSYSLNHSSRQKIIHYQFLQQMWDDVVQGSRSDVRVKIVEGSCGGLSDFRQRVTDSSLDCGD